MENIYKSNSVTVKQEIVQETSVNDLGFNIVISDKIKQPNEIKLEAHSTFKTNNEKENESGSQSISAQRLLMKRIPKERKKVFKCEICDKEFNRRFNMEKHLKIHAKVKLEVTNSGVDYEMALDIEQTGENSFECFKCHEKFNAERLLRIHMNRHDPATAKVSANNSNKKPFKCAECGYECVLKSSWMRHKKSDLTITLTSCEICKQQFSRRACLKIHRLKRHSLRLRIRPSYQCKLCNKQFQNRNYLKVHIRIHTGEKPYECFECHKKFRTHHMLGSHKLTHKPATQFSCQFCNKRFRRKSNYTTHLNIHTREKIYECSKCDNIFNEKHHFNDHLKSHARIGLKYACHFCEKSYIYNTRLQEHMTEVHKEIIPEKVKQSNKKITSLKNELQNNTCDGLKVSDNNSNKEPYKCVECGYKCLLKSIWMRHTKPDITEELKSCEFCKQQYSRRACLQVHRLKRHYWRIRIRAHQCKLCNKKFQNRSYLKVHMRIHTGEKPYECFECHKKFRTIHMLGSHKLTHKPATQFSCQFCDKKFRRKAHYKTHLNIHTREKIYECSKCDRKFIRKPHFDYHLKTHARIGLKFACHFCEKNYIHNTRLQEHMTEVHKKIMPKKVKQSNKQINKKTTSLENASQNNTSDGLKITLDTGSIQPANNKDLLSKPQDKMHHCQHCDKIFLNKRCLYLHEKTHESKEEAGWTFAEPQNKMYDCPHCDKKFIFATVFATHMKSHAASKIFSCSVCDKKLSSKNSLNKHEKLHDTKEQPFSCQICKQYFFRKRQLKEHMKIHTFAFENVFKCLQCNEHFLVQSALHRHMLVLHTRHKFEFCKICNTKYLNREKHMKTHTSEKLRDSWANEVMGESMLKPHLNVHSKNEKVIAEENEQIPLNSSQQEFQIILANIKTEEIDMVEPVIDEDINPKQNEVCEICNKVCSTKEKLERHIRQIHTGEKLFKCYRCHKEFTEQNDLKLHLKMHKNEKKEILENQNKASGNFKDYQLEGRNTSLTSEYVNQNTHSYLDSYLDSFISFLTVPFENVKHLQTNSKNNAVEVLKQNIPIGSQSKAEYSNQSLPSYLHSLQNFDPEKGLSNTKIISHTSSEQTESVPQDSLINEIETNTENIKIELVETAIVEHINTEICELKIEIKDSTLSSDKCIEETICKEEVILPDERI